MRIDDKRTHKRILQWKPIGTRIRGRPRKRWIVDIEGDMQIMGLRRWRKLRRLKSIAGCSVSKEKDINQ